MSASQRQEIEALARHLDELANDRDVDWAQRYTLRRPRMPPGLKWKLRWLAGRVVRGLESIGVLRPDPWPASLRQSGAGARAQPLLIWALGTDRDSLRKACDGIARLQASLPEFAPVLVTDVADFAFYSRLGWLVEYLPRLSGEGEPYDERKMKFLARLYGGAPVLPVSIGLDADCRVDDIRQYLERDD